MTHTDLQMMIDYVSIRHTRRDGSSCTHALTYEQATDLAKQADEVRLATIGLERIEVPAMGLVEGDYFEDIKRTVHETSIDGAHAFVWFQGDYSPLEIIATQEVNVLRRIS